MAESHTVSEYPLPVITHSGGDASQTVNQNTAITTIIYTASNATGIALSSGSFPTGVAGTANGTTYTISGTPSVVGTFGYAVTASHTNGCAGATSSGSLAVCHTPPPGAASTQTWTIGTQTWSAPIQIAPAGCTAATNFGSTNPPTTALYRNSGLVSEAGYLYNWKCANEQSAILCPSPWRIPSKDDIISLDISLGGTGKTRSNGSNDIYDKYVNEWGMVFVGQQYYAELHLVGTRMTMWTTSFSGANILVHEINLNENIRIGADSWLLWGNVVRCVR
jgi:uncharacterized protein (TIGR02145 family)